MIMKAKIFNEAKHQNEILNQIKKEVSELKSNLFKVPGIVFIVLRDHVENMRNSVSIYEKVAKELGFKTRFEFLPYKTEDDKLSKVVEEYSKNPEIHSVAILKPSSTGLIPVSLTRMFRNALSEFKNDVANEIERTRRQLNPFSLLRNYNLVRREFALRQGL